MVLPSAVTQRTRPPAVTMSPFSSSLVPVLYLLSLSLPSMYSPFASVTILYQISRFSDFPRTIFSATSFEILPSIPMLFLAFQGFRQRKQADRHCRNTIYTLHFILHHFQRAIVWTGSIPCLSNSFIIATTVSAEAFSILNCQTI